MDGQTTSLKRKRRSSVERKVNSKRSRISSSDPFALLSDELLLRVFALLPIADLVLCERVSKRFRKIATDSQLWKAAYYNRFVLPRASRIPGLRQNPLSHQSLLYSSRTSRWLDDDGLRKEDDTEWKKQYRIRHNWAKGSCGLSEIEVASRPSVPPLLVRLSGRTAFTVDKYNGLRAWCLRKSSRLLASSLLHGDVGNGPTSFAVSTDPKDSNAFAVAIGFESGQFSIYQFDRSTTSFRHVYSHPVSSIGMITGIALSDHYVLSITEHQLLSLYGFPMSLTAPSGELKNPELLSSLKSNTVWPPSCLSLRTGSNGLVASIAYAIPTFLSGWTVGLQELRLSSDGELEYSRLCSAVEPGFRRVDVDLDDLPASRPITLSYTHPYLLASHADNTLMLYMVTSNAQRLHVSKGTRLWGHTSSISGAHVADRGKAVSVSSRGGELRVWELEGGPASSRCRGSGGGDNSSNSNRELSVQIRPSGAGAAAAVLGVAGGRKAKSAPDLDSLTEAIRHRGDGLGLALECRAELHHEEGSVARGWVGFDDEQVVVLREKAQGEQALFVYDFT